MNKRAVFCTLMLLSLTICLSSQTVGVFAGPGENPPLPPPTTTCTISGRVVGDRPAYRTHINLFGEGDRKPRLSVRVSNGQYTIPNVPEGSYEVRGKMDNPMTRQTSRGPVGLKVIADDDQAVTCDNGQPVKVNFHIGSSEG